MEKIDSRTLLLKSCAMSSYFESTISGCSVASILYTLRLKLCFESLDICMKLTPVSSHMKIVKNLNASIIFTFIQFGQVVNSNWSNIISHVYTIGCKKCNNWRIYYRARGLLLMWSTTRLTCVDGLLLDYFCSSAVLDISIS